MKSMLVLVGFVLAVGAPVAANAVTVRAVAGDFDFVADDVLEVVLEIDEAQGLTGLEFSIVYPGDLLAVDQPSTHALGGFFSHAFVNHDADATGLPAGSKRISVAFAVAAPISTSAGTLLTLRFPLRCSDFSGGWPEGRPVTIEIQDAAAWTAQGPELPQPATTTVEGRTVTVDCTTVPVRDSGFSTLKARHCGHGGDR